MNRTALVIPALKNALVEAALGQQVAVVLPGHNSAREALNALLNLALDLNVVEVQRSLGRLRIRFDNGGQLIFFASVPETHGVSVDYVYAHEQFHDEENENLKPMIATTGGQVLYFH